MIIYRNKYPRGYYVYYYLRSQDSSQPHGARKGTPYYVGKGKRHRAWNKLHAVPLPSNPDNILIIAENLTADQAEQIEILHIAIWGRLDLNTGILRNRTKGGGGTKGFKHSPEECKRIGERSRKRKFTPEARAKIGLANKLRPVSQLTRDKHRAASTGRTHTEETKAKLRAVRKKQTFSAEARAKMSAAAKTRPRRPVSEETKRKIMEAHRLRRLNKLRQQAIVSIPNATEDQIDAFIEQALSPKPKLPRMPRGLMSEATKLKISAANKGRKPATTGKSLPQAVKDKISQAHKGKPKGPRDPVSVAKGIATKIARYGKGS